MRDVFRDSWTVSRPFLQWWRFALFSSKWRGEEREGERGIKRENDHKQPPPGCLTVPIVPSPRPALLVHLPPLDLPSPEILGGRNFSFLWEGKPHSLQPGLLALPPAAPPHSLRGNVSQSLCFPANNSTPRALQQQRLSELVSPLSFTLPGEDLFSHPP